MNDLDAIPVSPQSANSRRYAFGPNDIHINYADWKNQADFIGGIANRIRSDNLINIRANVFVDVHKRRLWPRASSLTKKKF